MATKNDGVIVALLPNEEYTRLRPATQNHHMTVAYIGTLNDEAVTEEKLEKFWDSLSRTWTHPLQAKVTAETAFPIGDNEWAYVDLIDVPFLPDYRSIVQELLELHGIPLSREFGLLPHITKRYAKAVGNVEMVHTVFQPRFTFTKSVLWAGDRHFELELT